MGTLQRRNPHILEINTHAFLRRLSSKYRRTLSLSIVPEEEWRAIARLGFDLVWLMGIWKRSPGARRVALAGPEQFRHYDDALHDWREDDVAGSAYAVLDYALDPNLGQPSELMTLRQTLNRLGLSLMLDFVPNHLALDHPWTVSNPDRLVRGDDRQRNLHPEWFFASDEHEIFAHGRDPNFPPWIDTVQVNFFSLDLRRALFDEVLRIAEVSDGIRCDMAMLGLNRVFESVWGRNVDGLTSPASEFWFELITAVRKRFPHFLFLAEAYWNLEGELLELGFDYAYDKAFYDALRLGSATDVRTYLAHERFNASQAVRFIENHDEPRAVEALGRERSLAAAAVLATLPGARLFQDGQLEGRRVRLPVQLVREPPETGDLRMTRWYEQLLRVCSAAAYHEGSWALVDTLSTAGPGPEDLLVWKWRFAGVLKLVVVNYAPRTSRGLVPASAIHATGSRLRIRDEMPTLRDPTATSPTPEVAAEGLLIELGPWQSRLLDIEFAASER